MNIIGLILSIIIDSRTGRLLHRTAMLPDVNPRLVAPAVYTALLEETPAVSAELILAISWGETRLEPWTITGIACGPMSTICKTKATCDSVRNFGSGYRAGVQEIETMLQDRRVGGRMRLALLYFACGNSAFNNTCSKTAWPEWTLRRAEFLASNRQYNE